jgi:hypothetical protein
LFRRSRHHLGGDLQDRGGFGADTHSDAYSNSNADTNPDTNPDTDTNPDSNPDSSYDSRATDAGNHGSGFSIALNLVYERTVSD